MFGFTHRIVLSDLSVREKDKYYDLLISNDVKFYKEGESYCANVRLSKKSSGSPSEHKILHSSVSPPSTFVSKKVLISLEERLDMLKTTTEFPEEMADYARYVTFSRLSYASREYHEPRSKSFIWLMRVIEDLYDAKYNYERVDDASVDGTAYLISSVSKKVSTIFPVFVFRHFFMRYGSHSDIDQRCNDLIASLILFRDVNMECELFGRFLDETYGYNELLLFLHMRFSITRLKNISTLSSRWEDPQRLNANAVVAPFLSFEDCVQVAIRVFGASPSGSHTSPHNLEETLEQQHRKQTLTDVFLATIKTLFPSTANHGLSIGFVLVAAVETFRLVELSGEFRSSVSSHVELAHRVVGQVVAASGSTASAMSTDYWSSGYLLLMQKIREEDFNYDQDDRLVYRELTFDSDIPRAKHGITLKTR